jgi:hypothetical protein
MRAALAATATAAVVAVPWGVFQVLDRSAGDAVARPPGLAGTYRVVVGRGTADVRGRWTVTLGGDGSITLEAPAGYSGDLGAGESYEVSAPGELKTNLLVGAPGCQRADPPLGVYHFTATTSGVQFSVVDDSCPSRRTLLTGSWERIR